MSWKYKDRPDGLAARGRISKQLVLIIIETRRADRRILASMHPEPGRPRTWLGSVDTPDQVVGRWKIQGVCPDPNHFHGGGSAKF